MSFFYFYTFGVRLLVEDQFMRPFALIYSTLAVHNGVLCHLTVFDSGDGKTYKNVLS